MELHERIRKRRQEMGLTLLQVAKRCGVSEATICRWESGKVDSMRQDKVEDLAAALSATPAYVMGFTTDPTRFVPDDCDESFQIPEKYVQPIYRIPVIGKIAAGYDNFAHEDWTTDEMVEVPKAMLKGCDKEDLFVLEIHGNSMYPQFLEGDKVVIMRQNSLVRSGQIAAVLYEDEYATLKRIEYEVGKDELHLVPINPEYVPKVIKKEEFEHFRILGVPKVLLRGI